MIGIQRGATHS